MMMTYVSQNEETKPGRMNHYNNITLLIEKMPICYKEEKSVDGKVIKEGKLKMMRSCGGVLAAKSCLTFATPLTAAHQAPLSMGFSRQEYWSGLPFSSPEDLPDPGIEPGSPALQADSLPTEVPGTPGGYKGELKNKYRSRLQKRQL